MTIDGGSHRALILCDWAEVINGKLYIMGGGISQVVAHAPVSIALAVLMNISWQETNRPQRMRIVLVDEDGKPLPAGPEGEAFAIEGNIEVGRPAGIKPGNSFPTPVALKMPPMVLPLGGYRFELYVNDSLEEVAAFQAVTGGILQ